MEVGRGAEKCEIVEICFTVRGGQTSGDESTVTDSSVCGFSTQQCTLFYSALIPDCFFKKCFQAQRVGKSKSFCWN